jgi:serine protease Do
MTTLWQQMNREMAGIVEGVRGSLVTVSNDWRGGGAGTLWHSDGLVVTNAHVVRRRSPKVTLPDGRTLAARLLAYDQAIDLAALSVQAENLPAIALGDSKRLKPGDWVVALGHPWGVKGAASAGMVIDVGRPLEMPQIEVELIQVGLNLRPGHSGGPLVDGEGRLVGINTMISGPQVGLAVPVYVVKEFLRRALGSPATADLTPKFV